jgi:D-proline reductase (dithiol) PrdB
MPHLADLPFTLRTALKLYRWRRLSGIAWVRLARPLDQCRVAICSTAGMVAPGQPPFDCSVKGGDFSFRVIDRDTVVGSLIDTHRSTSYDHAGIEADANLAFPLDRLGELAVAGRIGVVAEPHLSFMGSITAPNRLLRKTAPEAAEILVADQVDVALLVPV